MCVLIVHLKRLPRLHPDTIPYSVAIDCFRYNQPYEILKTRAVRVRFSVSARLLPEP